MSESPEPQGRAVAALAADPAAPGWSGQLVLTAEVAWKDGVTDVGGRQPRPLAHDEA